MTAPPRPASPPEIVLDLSRLLSRVLHRTPTGVDRVEMAYARTLAARIPDRLAFGAVHPTGIYGRIPPEVARDFLASVAASWDDPAAHRDRARRAMAVAAALANLRPRAVLPSSRPRVLVQSSPNHLHDARIVRRKLAREKARWICLIHDLIPIEYPEYARPGGAAIHRRRMDVVAKHADGVVANSMATRDAFLPFLAAARRDPDVAVAHLGLDPVRADVPRQSDERPYFLCLGTIEPRKNHLLLLHVWRRLAEIHGADAIPRLLVVGRRGWENEQVIDLLERCPALSGCVREIGGMPDGELRRTMAGARALLLPSFAEGYGMPVPEAIAMGVPVICSDLPALREAGGNVPDYLDPLDGPAWMRAVLDYAAPDGGGHAAQVARMRDWTRPSWDDHIDIVLAMADRLA